MSFDYTYYWDKIRQDDEKALEKLFKETHLQLRFYAWHITGDLYTAEEVVQDVFLRIWQKRKDIDLKSSIKAYLYQSTHNIAVSTLLKHSTQKQSVNTPVSAELWQYIENNLDVNAFLLEKLEADETEEIITNVIKELPEQGKEVFTLSRFDQKSNKEIADQLKITESTVKTHISRALKKIKEALDKN